VKNVGHFGLDGAFWRERGTVFRKARSALLLRALKYLSTSESVCEPKIFSDVKTFPRGGTKRSAESRRKREGAIGSEGDSRKCKSPVAITVKRFFSFYLHHVPGIIYDRRLFHLR